MSLGKRWGAREGEGRQAECCDTVASSSEYEYSGYRATVGVGLEEDRQMCSSLLLYRDESCHWLERYGI